MSSSNANMFVLETKFPNIKPIEGEDLNIENNIRSILNKCWFDLNKFKTVTDVAAAMGINERVVHKWVKKYKLPNRKKLKARGY